MNGIMKMFLAAFSIAFLAAGVNALQVNPQINTEANVLNLESGQSIGTIVSITNSSSDGMDLSFRASTSDFDLELIPEKKDFTLNPHETIYFSVTIVATEDADEGTHFVDLNVEGDGVSAGKTLTIEVEESAQLELVPEQDIVRICKEPYTHYIDVEVRNTSSLPKTVQLKGESEILLPVFDPTELTVAGSSESTVRMKIHINYTTQYGEYDVPIFAFEGDNVVERNVVVEVVGCEPDETPFRLEIIDDELSIEKGDEEKARFRLVSLIDEEQDVRISAVSTLKVEQFDDIIHLDEFESVESKLLVYAEDEDKADEHIVTVYAWNDKGEESEEIEVEVEPMHKLSARLLNNDITNRVCSAVDFEVFELEVSDEGDLREKVVVSVDNDYDTIGIHITEDNFYLDEGEKKVVQIAVQPAFDTPLGEKTITLKVDSTTDSGFEFEEQLNFTVIESPLEIMEDVLQIISYPRSISVGPGEQMGVKIGIKNPTNADVGPLTVRVRGTSSQFSFTGDTISSIPAGEAMEVTGNINVSANADNKKYDLTLEVVGDGYYSYVPFELEIASTSAQAEGEQDRSQIGITLLAGLFEGTLLGGLTILMIALALIIILIVFLLASSNKTDPHWVSRRSQRS